MSIVTNGIAHVSFHGAGAFLPVRSPYDQELFIEHVIQQARSKGIIQVLVGSHRWLVDGRTGHAAPQCSICGRNVMPVSCCSHTQEFPCCINCALSLSLGNNLPPARRPREDSPPLVRFPQPASVRAAAR